MSIDQGIGVEVHKNKLPCDRHNEEAAFVVTIGATRHYLCLKCSRTLAGIFHAKVFDKLTPKSIKESSKCSVCKKTIPVKLRSRWSTVCGECAL